MYIYIYIYVYMCIYIYMYIHVHVYIYIYISIYTYIHISLYVYIYIYIYIHTYISTYHIIYRVGPRRLRALGEGAGPVGAPGRSLLERRYFISMTFVNVTMIYYICLVCSYTHYHLCVSLTITYLSCYTSYHY